MILEMTRPVQGGLRHERKLDVTSNHLANVSTPGFKKDVVSFTRFFNARMNTDMTQAEVHKTGNTLDLALTDEGFFKIQTPLGPRYTRNGSFTLDNNGVLVDQKGNMVLGKNGPIILNAENIYINKIGEVEADGVIIDRLDIVTFDVTERLQKESGDSFVYKGFLGDEKEPVNISVEQGALESSNVNAVHEMVTMIDHHRMYETFQKMMLTFDEIDGKAINDLGKLR